MSWIKKIFVFFYIGFSSIALLLIIDFLIGGFLIPCYERQNLSFAKCKNTDANTFGVSNPVYHHDLSKNYRGFQNWGAIKVNICTDENGFKISCNATNTSSNNFDIAFIGDSFTEGTGLSYEETFVGKISKSRPELKIANLGVSSYSPSIYFSKVNYLLEQGIKFKELVVYIDISDIQDEATEYELSNDIVVPKAGKISGYATSFKKLARWAFPLTHYGLHRLKKLYIQKLQATYLMPDYQRSAWTYNPSSIGYGEAGVKGGIEQSLMAMTKLSDLLKDKGINLSVGIYPWPAQLLYDSVNSEQVRIWEDFCKYRCVAFYNSFESFFALADKTSANKTIELYFIAGDVHHNGKGAEVIANDFLNAPKK
jgi:hypothetical protein